jgi:hypothetical protein
MQQNIIDIKTGSLYSVDDFNINGKTTLTELIIMYFGLETL